ncbi:ribosomal protein S18 acetylase RimI-like enzyme [Allocatelliglobosispora scoriae]|uniref:Ribosomal protein S18 acetylase RimI-like enzyme n=1 Tax=Allocatelliglobosispora scoriae TaxID=643052 RepID=A0A841BMA6_9ACTN|nr:GNAT family N-acetyltransferase [Allocatelliglobosispora scoriae]MBB5867892.1 ribosomal protein S18 acetylase RimI-like enzyme [Allocatelliglobosispora scoriae]
MSTLTFRRHAAAEVPDLLDALCDVYADAYGHVPGEDSTVKTEAFRDRADAALDASNYELVTAWDSGGIVGFVFGYSLRPERGWWNGLNPEPAPGFIDETGDRTVVLAEIEVRSAWQGRGVGHRLHDEFLGGRGEERATLASNPAAAETHALYQGWGWRRVGVVPGRPGSYYTEYVRFVLPLRPGTAIA